MCAEARVARLVLLNSKILTLMKSQTQNLWYYWNFYNHQATNTFAASLMFPRRKRLSEPMTAEISTRSSQWRRRYGHNYLQVARIHQDDGDRSIGSRTEELKRSRVTTQGRRNMTTGRVGSRARSFTHETS